MMKSLPYYVWLDGRDKSLQNNMTGYRIAYTFEGFSGADCVITPIKDQLSRDTMQTHLDAGAVMLQAKNSRDFDASVIDQRLFESLLRMNTWKTQAYQCGLLITGEFTNVNGHLYIDHQRSMISWASFKGAWEAWVIRGGVVHPIIKLPEVQSFIDSLGSKLFVSDPFVQRGAAKPRRKFKPAKEFKKGMSLSQRARMAVYKVEETDLRHLLVNLSGLSDTKVQGIWDLMKENKVQMNMTGFVNLLQKDAFLNVNGIGKVTNENIKKQLGY